MCNWPCLLKWCMFNGFNYKFSHQQLHQLSANIASRMWFWPANYHFWRGRSLRF
jgi:hypothetical protein